MTHPPLHDPIEATLLARLQEDPEDFHARIQLGAFYQETDRIIDATRVFREATDHFPNDARGYSALGASLLAMDQLDGAEKALVRALELDPRDVSSMSNLGHVRTIQERFDEAGTLLRGAVDGAPGEPSFHNNLAALYARTGRMEEAIACARRALELNPDFEAARRNLGVAAYALGRFGEAAETLDMVLDFNANDRVALILGGQAHMRSGRKFDGIRRLHRLTLLASHSQEGQAAAQILSEMKEEHETFVGLAWKEAAKQADRGVDLVQAEDYDRAEQAFLEAIATCPGPPPSAFFEALASARAATGRVLEACDAYYQGLAAVADDPGMPLRFARFLMSVEDYFHAIVMLRETLERGGEALDERARASVNGIIAELQSRLSDNADAAAVAAALEEYASARRALLEGRFDEARSRVEQSIRQYPRNLDACWLLGRILYRSHDFAALAELLVAFARFFPALGDMQYNAATALRQAGSAERSLDYFEAALRLHPKNPTYRTDYANTLQALGREEEARAQIEEATRCGPENALAWFNRSVIERLQERGEEADRALEQALKAAPRGPLGAIIRARARQPA